MSLTFDEFNAQLRQTINGISNLDNAVYMAAQTAHADMVERIFTDGKASDGTSIGEYSNKPLYVDPNNAPRNFPTVGKTGKSTFKKGQPHKTGYFEGYKKFRAAQSRPDSIVNLDLFGNLKSEFENSLQREGNGWESSLRTNTNIKKAEGNQARFGKTIFGASEKEQERFTEILTLEIRQIINA